MSVNLEIAQSIVDRLNSALELDRNAIACLIANRVPCNQALAEHPTVQVGAQHGGFNVGMLGILNGLCGVYDDGPKKGWGAIAAEFEDDPDGKDRFRTLSRFIVVPNE